MVLAVLGVLASALVYFTVSSYRQWSRRHDGWAPPRRQPDDAAGDPYRGPSGDPRLHRPAPPAVHRATAVVGASGGLFVLAGFELLVFSVGFACGGGPTSLPIAPMALLGGLAITTGVQLFRAGPLLLGGDGQARRAAAVASRWSTGLGVAAFAILFMVLGGAYGEHDGRLCLALLVASLLSLAVAGVCSRAHEATPEPDPE